MASDVSYHGSAAVENWDEVVKCLEVQNRYGLDGASLCGVIAFAIELYQRGILSRQETGGLELDWGAETVQALTEDIVHRRGLGDILGLDGVANIN